MLEQATDPIEIQVCKRLWAAVFRMGIEDAINDIQGGRYWLCNDDRHCAGSFKWLCDLFGYNHEYIRNIIKNQYKYR